MLPEELDRLKTELKEILPEEGISTVIKAIKSHIPSDAPKFNAILQIESRLNEANLKRIKGVLSEDQLQLQYNQLRDDLLSFIDGLRPEDFSKEAAKKSKTGSVLYKVPREMELQKRSKCIVRLAYEESVIIQNIDLTSDTSIQSIRVSEAMEVAIIDPDGGKNFSIQAISSPEQFLEEDDYSEWVFYVTPLTVGSHPIILKVSVIELIAGKERKKEIVLEEIVTIVTQPVEEEEASEPFQNAGYMLAFSGVGQAETAGLQPSKPSTTRAVSAGFRKYGMVAGALAMLVVASWAIGLFTFVSWQETRWSDTVEAYEGFMLKHPGSKYVTLAQQHRDLKVAVNERSDSLLVEFLVDYPQSELKEDAETTFRQISDKDLEEWVKRRKAEKDKEKDGRSRRGPSLSSAAEPNQHPEGSEGSAGLATTQPEGAEALENGGEQLPEAGLEGNDAPPGEEPTNGQTTEPLANRTTLDATPLPGSSLGKLSIDEKKALEALSWLELNMVSIEGGKFMMGCDAEEEGCPKSSTPKREVKVSDFRLCRYEVTQILWQAIMEDNPSYEEVRQCQMCPVENVSFRDVMEFIKRLNKKSGKKYRLPSEAEWEYAARGGIKGSPTIYAGSDNLNEIAWYNANSRHRPQPVGKKKPNSLGIFDMSGSVFEWCEDTWNPNYKNAPSNGKPWVKKNRSGHRIIRGGSWLDDPEYLRVDYRDMDIDSLRNHITGFRLASD